ncbi:hypothetical protein [Spirulina sp. 06S082]|uniref:hypothetical protein n=1 Tax=Spirulina sp. 06S082 TaxID=3110248 RepID=UPI002B21DE63|nr:hypothetical protein [Spirulina sp. 06S082]MEA5471565.1 hypothetical protein [Spirulina sp. 06S082]
MVASNALLQQRTQNNIWGKVENYLLNTPFWKKRQEIVEKEFRALFYHRNNNPDAIAEELENVNRLDFIRLLRQRGILGQARILRFSQWFQEICQEVVNAANAARERRKAMNLIAKVQLYLVTTPKQELSPEGIDRDFKKLLWDPKANFSQLKNRLFQLNSFFFRRIFAVREDISDLEISAIITELEMARDRVLEEAQLTSQLTS